MLVEPDHRSASSAPTARRIGNYRWSWQERQRDVLREVDRPRPTGRWLVFADRGGLGTQLGHLLSQRGDICQFVRAGERFDRTSEAYWTINPADDADFSRLFREIDSDVPLSTVVYLWACDADSIDDLTPELLEEDQLFGCGGAAIGPSNDRGGAGGGKVVRRNSQRRLCRGHRRNASSPRPGPCVRVCEGDRP